MKFLDNFTKSDYAERDPKRKLDVGLAHAFVGCMLAVVGIPLWLIAVGYLVKEVSLDILRRATGSPLRWVLADSIVDWSFTVMGAAMVAHGDWRWGAWILVVGAAYFIFGKR